MRIAVIGGGPSGLYFALLAKKTWPVHEVTVYERNRPDDTFGFGVVFSDETLDHFLARDPESYDAITEQFAYWDEIDFILHGENVFEFSIEGVRPQVEAVIDLDELRGHPDLVTL